MLSGCALRSLLSISVNLWGSVQHVPVIELFGTERTPSPIDYPYFLERKYGWKKIQQPTVNDTTNRYCEPVVMFYFLFCFFGALCNFLLSKQGHQPINCQKSISDGTSNSRLAVDQSQLI